MRVSITIMAHPKRRAAANALLVQLAGQGFVNRYITWDQSNNEWDTGRRALEAGIEAGAEWHIVLQDDAVLAPDFYNHVTAALAAVPMRSLVSFYTGTVRPLPDRVANAVSRANGVSWLQFNTLLWGVGIAIPTDHIAPMLGTIEDRTEVYDTRIGVAYQRVRLPVFYTNPSLVDHNDGLGSLIGNGYAAVPRVAHNFIGNKKAAWNSRAIDI